MSEELQLDDDLVEELEIMVDAGQSPVRLDRFLGDRIMRVSRNKIQNAIRAGSVLVNDDMIKPNYKVRPLDKVKVYLPRSSEHSAEVIPEDMPLNIAFEDDDILIVNKPSGLVVHPGIGNRSGTLVNGLAHYFKSKEMPVMEGNSDDRPGLVHRIDKETSGLLVIAKNDYAMTSLAKQFFDHTIEREYVALVWGAPEPAKGTIDAFIGRHPTQRTQMHVFSEGDEGKHAVTHYETIEDLYYVSLIKCHLETGRTHQIRVHMKSLGNPVFNDNRYGGDRVVKGTVFSKYKQFVRNTFEVLPRQALHAKSLGFVHPRTGETVRFESELPDDMQAALDRWRNYVTHRKSHEG